MTIVKRLGVVSGLMVLLCASSARADILLSDPVIRQGLACVPACAAGEFQWVYLAGLSQNERLVNGAVPGVSTNSRAPSDQTADYFTIFDFLSYIPGTETHPADWGFQAALQGSTPDNILPIDSLTIPNLTRYYTGNPINGPQVLGFFSAKSLLGTSTVGQYAASATNAGAAPGTQDNKISDTIVPVAAVPEPASLLLLGTGLLGLAKVYRRRPKG